MESIRKCLVIGHSGFIGRHFCQHFRTVYPQIIISGTSEEDLDMTASNGHTILARLIDEETCIVMMAAVKRQSSDDPDAFLANIKMLVNLAKVISKQPIGRLVYLSSAAIYGEDVSHAAITEKTLPTPRSYYGMAKYAAENLLIKAIGEERKNRLVLVRPTTIFGADEPGTAYGPAGFLKRALNGETITLWGDGSELRDFVHVDDAVRILARLCVSDFSGLINLVSGESLSFKDIIMEISKLRMQEVKIVSRQRSKDKVDQKYDNHRLSEWMPGFHFQPVAEALKHMHEVATSHLR